jgi:tetratricopeptide (TPR) repeat protein
MRILALILLLACPTLTNAQQPDPFDQITAAQAAYEEQRTLGNFAGAEQIARAAIELGEATIGPDAQLTLEMRVRLGQALAAQGRLKEALPVLRDTYDRWQANYTAYTLGLKSAQMEYAIVLSDTGSPEQALPLALDALRFIETAWGSDHQLTVVWKLNAATMYEKLGYLDQALAITIDLIDHFRTRDDRTSQRRAAVTGQNIAFMLGKTGREDQAAPYWTEAMQRFDAAYGPAHPATLEATILYLQHLYATQRYDDMALAIDRARPQVRQTFGDRSVIMYHLREQAAILSARRANGGEGLVRAAAEMRAVAEGFADLLGPQAEPSGLAWLNAAAMLSEIGDHGGALQAALSAERARAGSRNTLYNTLWNAFDAGAIDHDTMMTEVVRIAQIGHQSVFKTAAQMQGRRIELRGGPAEAAYRQMTDREFREKALQADLLERVSLPADRRDSAAENSLRDELEVNAAEIDRLLAQVQAAAPAGAAMLGDGVIGYHEIQTLLGPDEALVIFDLPKDPDDDGMIIAISSDKADWWLAGAATDQLALAAADLRASIDLRFGLRSAASLAAPSVTPDRTAFDYFAAEFLYRNTFGVAEPVIAGKTHLYVDLRGPLSGLPPQLLVKSAPDAGPETAQWLIRDHAVTVIPSAFALKVANLAGGVRRDRRPLLALADPDFGARADDTVQMASLGAGQGNMRGALAPLPETRAEVQAVAQALGAAQSDLRAGTDASEAAVKSADLAGFEVLYFATHGLVAGDLIQNGELAEPALALTAGGGEDGLLTQSEIAALTLDADLVVLSACNTAVGGEPGAEALSGLAQAFSYAGARALMVSHWPVESKSAVALMTDIFARRAADPGLSLAQAQQQAILTLIDDPKNPDWRHPAYWAPFVLVGSTD